MQCWAGQRVIQSATSRVSLRFRVRIRHKQHIIEGPLASRLLCSCGCCSCVVLKPYKDQAFQTLGSRLWVVNVMIF